MDKVNYELEEVTLIEAIVYKFSYQQKVLNVSDGEIKTRKLYGDICQLSEQNISRIDSVKLPFENRSFNFVLCISIIDMIQFNAIVNFIAELARVSENYILIVSSKDYRDCFKMLGLKIINEMKTYEDRRTIWLLEK